MFLEIAERAIPKGAHEEKNPIISVWKGNFLLFYFIQLKSKGLSGSFFPVYALKKDLKPLKCINQFSN